LKLLSRVLHPVLGVGFALIAACGSERSPGSSSGGAPASGGASSGATSSGGTTPGATSGGSGGSIVAAGAAPVAGHSGGSAAPIAGSQSGGKADTPPATGGAAGATASGGGEGITAGRDGFTGGAGAGGRASMPSGGGAGDGGAASGAGSGGATSASSKCPPGPYPTPMVVSSKSVCQSFAFAYSHNEGPTWVASQKAFFFTNFVAQSGSGGDILRYTPGGNCEVFIRDVGCNGLAVSLDGNLLAACQQTRSIVRFDLTTKQATTVADHYMGKLLDTPNDLVQHSNGTIYFTNPPNELDGRTAEAGRATFRVDAKGTVSLVGEGDCNGIALSPDEKKLYVILSKQWDLDAQGAPSNPKAMFTGGDGVAIDCAGNVYANGSIFSAEGSKLGSWGAGTNLAFGGEDGKTVLVAGPGKQLRELTMNVPGLP
jgi:gluconolactonase